MDSKYDNTAPAVHSGERWLASLDVEFDDGPRLGKTRLKDVRHFGPLRVQRPFYPEPDGTCHVYLLHPPGGLVGGDSLEVRVSNRGGARSLLTTPGATKCYRCDGQTVSVSQTIVVDEDASCEWLPQETILFDGANLCQRTRFEVAKTGSLVAWDTLVLGRWAAGEGFTRGRWQQRLELYRDGLPLVCERTDLRPNRAEISESWGLSGAPVLSTLYFVNDDTKLHEDLLRDVRDAGLEGARFAGTHWDSISVYRYIGPSPEEARTLTETVWTMYRNHLGRTEGHRPRIWQT
ncbi:MAG: urease accessory protein UreD [Polyangiaceae bacterium]